MGHFCRVCVCSKPNEQFSGKRHKNHICKACSGKPKEERCAIDQENEIFGFMSQSNISRKNMAHLHKLKLSANQCVSELADIALAVALVKPHKKRMYSLRNSGYSSGNSGQRVLACCDEAATVLVEWLGFFLLAEP